MGVRSKRTGGDLVATSLHVTTVTRFGATTEIITFQKWTDAINAKVELQESYQGIPEVAIIVTLLEGTA